MTSKSYKEKDCFKVVELFNHYGFKKTSLEQVAKVMGVSRQTLYTKYGTKENLLTSILEEECNNIEKRAIKVLKESRGNREKLRLIIITYYGDVVNFLENSTHPKELFNESHAIIGKVVEEHFGNFRSFIQSIFEDCGVEREQAITTAEIFSYTIEGIMEQRFRYEKFVEKVDMITDFYFSFRGV